MERKEGGRVVEKGNDKFVAYEPDYGETECFDTYEEAEAWLLDQDFSEEISEAYILNEAYIAKIVARSAYKETDKKENYSCLRHPEKPAYCPTCDEKDCDGTEVWGYSQCDAIGEVVMVKEVSK